MLASVLALAACRWSAAAPQDRPGRPDTPSAPAAASQLASDARDELTRVLLDRPAVPITPPTVVQPVQPEVVLPTEGTMIVDRGARLSHVPKSGWFLLSFEDDPTLPAERPRFVLPCQLLEKMEEHLARDPNVAFRVSGDTTVYESRCYIMLGKAVVETPRPPAPRPTASSEPAPATARASAPASASTSVPAGASRPTSGASSDDILSRLLQERPGTPVTVPATPARTTVQPLAAPPPAQEPISSDPGWLVVDRVVRVMREKTSKWWQAHFEANNTLHEGPVRVLPSSLLERVESGGPNPAKFRISGVITTYKGTRYLLLRKALPERQMGQF